MKDLINKIHECGGIVEFRLEVVKFSFLYCPKCFAFLKTSNKSNLINFPDGIRPGYNFNDWMENRKNSEYVGKERKRKNSRESK